MLTFLYQSDSKPITCLWKLIQKVYTHFLLCSKTKSARVMMWWIFPLKKASNLRYFTTVWLVIAHIQRYTLGHRHTALLNAFFLLHLKKWYSILRYVSVQLLFYQGLSSFFNRKFVELFMVHDITNHCPF